MFFFLLVVAELVNQQIEMTHQMNRKIVFRMNLGRCCSFIGTNTVPTFPVT